MKTRATISILAAFFLFIGTVSAQSDEIIKQERTTGEFKGIKVSNGIEVFLSQSEKTSVVVETYADKQNKVKTEVKNGLLKIYIDGNFNRKTSPKVYVSNQIFEQIAGGSGSSVQCETKIKSDKLYLDFGSAASFTGTLSGKEINFDVSSGASCEVISDSRELYIDASSGANMEIKGKTEKLLVDASSGATIEAYELSSKTCALATSSGASLEIFVEEQVAGKASSGSVVNCKGGASTESCNTSSGAEIKCVK